MTPRRYLHDGASALADLELLTLALGVGPAARGLAASADLLAHHGSLEALVHAGPEALLRVPGVGRTRAARVHAALEIGRRSLRAPSGGACVSSPDDAHAVLGPPLRGLADEELHGLFLDRRRRPVARRTLTRGSDAFTVVDPRQVFRVAVQVRAAAVVLAHNHPSGDPTPSAMDRQVTRRVAAAGRVLGVPLLDHLVIGAESYVSLAELGEVPAPASAQPAWTA